MATSISEDPSTSMSSKKEAGKIIRTCPSNTCSASNKDPDEGPDEKIASQYKNDMDMRKLMFMRNLLKAEVKSAVSLSIPNTHSYRFCA